VDELIREGGPHGIRRHGEHEFSIPVPNGADGLVGRRCPVADCSPAYFRVKLGTGITGDAYQKGYCPYCRGEADPSSFYTREQINYAKRVIENEVGDWLDRTMQKAFGTGPSRRKKIGGGFLSMEMSFTPPAKRPVWHPMEEELRRDVTCPRCTLQHSVFGLATWCPDCGADIFCTHVAAELDVIRQMLGHVEKRREELGSRVAARDVENALEDAVSIFEAVLKIITRRGLRAAGRSPEDIEDILQKTVRNAYQSVSRGAALFEQLLGFPLFDGVSAAHIAALEATFEKRHPITHNLGMLDRKYLERVQSGELEGREVRVTVEEVTAAVDLVQQVTTAACGRLPA
jgi:hypothetical protein